MSNQELVSPWVTGWCLSRGIAVDETGDGILAVQVAEPGRSVELLVLDADDNPERVERAAALALAAAGAAWVTVATDHLGPRLDQLRAAGMRVKPEPECLMTMALKEQMLTAVAAPYVVQCTADSGVLSARAILDGVVAASGRMAVVGTDAVADRIETDPAHRRRGLGRALMAALAAGALEMGAERGVLGASSDGRSLYQALGWTVAADLAIATTV